ncbi:tRNA (adenosine(37)-N6)-dimethylallyltransferase MiaA [Sphingobacterium sp. SRCM116780]|uniref:tRNA (adenosine(37)-N6)-dimethylallyltransferase MiaA n=1 Tax=Sphingobacterium sp. SRCM116780 TaxID=2907623 RepID=UPI001F00142C|nr:tRNA (adenosine(37)-N6)-dimethylallyltransferase MiaA [Sphingobacterium sp. SRCM116780]UIR55808.1 tRNA (adenosine(37)-N6)-dimethylallyltransferase MiaA [Sphingobacterium sp. SRCM116780]
MINEQQTLLSSLALTDLPKEKVIVILGPTASGKTALAVQIAKELDAEIISADSRQVYRRMDIGTGKDLSEYQNISYHLINICEPGEKYHLGQFIEDFQQVYQSLLHKKKRIILCGGTGLYLQSIIQGTKYAQIPSQAGFKESLYQLDRNELLDQLANYQKPDDLYIDLSTKKRIIRGIEILEWLKHNPMTTTCSENLNCIVIGINPDVATRRHKISKRLHQRLQEGLIEEVQSLLAGGISHEELHYYGLEYKYVSKYILGQLNYEEFYRKLETEIHRYAKRQMTYFRKMEKDGIKINWIV